MALEIREIAVRMRVSDGAGNEAPAGAAPPAGDRVAAGDRAALVDECVRRVLATLKAVKER